MKLVGDSFARARCSFFVTRFMGRQAKTVGAPSSVHSGRQGSPRCRAEQARVQLLRELMEVTDGEAQAVVVRFADATAMAGSMAASPVGLSASYAHIVDLARRAKARPRLRTCSDNRWRLAS